MAKWDSAKLARMVKRLEKLPELAEAAAAVASELMVEMAKRDSRLGVNPSGKKWKKLKSGDGLPNKWASGTIKRRLRGKKIRISSTASYSLPHQAGASKKPQLLPSKPISFGLKYPSIPKVSIPSLPSLPKASIPSLPSVSIPSFSSSNGLKYKRMKWKLPRRQMVPSGRLPRRWSKAIEKEIKKLGKKFGIKAKEMR